MTKLLGLCFFSILFNIAAWGRNLEWQLPIKSAVDSTGNFFVAARDQDTGTPFLVGYDRHGTLLPNFGRNGLMPLEIPAASFYKSMRIEKLVCDEAGKLWIFYVLDTYRSEFERMLGPEFRGLSRRIQEVISPDSLLTFGAEKSLQAFVTVDTQSGSDQIPAENFRDLFAVGADARNSDLYDVVLKSDRFYLLVGGAFVGYETDIDPWQDPSFERTLTVRAFNRSGAPDVHFADHGVLSLTTLTFQRELAQLTGRSIVEAQKWISENTDVLALAVTDSGNIKIAFHSFFDFSDDRPEPAQRLGVLELDAKGKPLSITRNPPLIYPTNGTSVTAHFLDGGDNLFLTGAFHPEAPPVGVYRAATLQPALGFDRAGVASPGIPLAFAGARSSGEIALVGATPTRATSEPANNRLVVRAPEHLIVTHYSHGDGLRIIQRHHPCNELLLQARRL